MMKVELIPIIFLRFHSWSDVDFQMWRIASNCSTIAASTRNPCLISMPFHQRIDRDIEVIAFIEHDQLIIIDIRIGSRNRAWAWDERPKCRSHAESIVRIHRSLRSIGPAAQPKLGTWWCWTAARWRGTCNTRLPPRRWWIAVRWRGTCNTWLNGEVADGCRGIIDVGFEPSLFMQYVSKLRLPSSLMKHHANRCHQVTEMRCCSHRNVWWHRWCSSIRIQDEGPCFWYNGRPTGIVLSYNLTLTHSPLNLPIRASSAIWFSREQVINASVSYL